MSEPRPPKELRELILSVARSVHWAAVGGADGGETWADLSEEEKAQFQLIASAAMQAHDEWLGKNGFKILPPGSVNIPTSDEEAAAMSAAVAHYKRTARAKPKLVVPNREILRPGVH